MRKAALITPFDEISIGVLAASPDFLKHRHSIMPDAEVARVCEIN